MIVEVAVLPQMLQNAERKTCIVIDVLRASTTLVTMLERGAPMIRLAGSVEEARTIQAGQPDALLCGEHGGLAPAGFHYGNSPVEYQSLDLAERHIVYATSNGTKALAELVSAPTVLIGCFRNVSAVVEAALAIGQDIAIVCAGRATGTAYGLDDVFCAGYMVGKIMAHVEIGDEADLKVDFARLISGGEFETDRWFIDESAIAAYRLCTTYGGDIQAAFRESGNGKGLIQLGLESDLRFCGEVDTSRVVPTLANMRQGIEVVKRAEIV
ncbi:MAG: 2-phosphosulfolactate phosphatase [Dehalococcoidia bacterium]|nr:2-phosphosulfolactate phosphatase [Dehalococcoidia bacterium]